MIRIGIVGTGYVGLVTGACLSKWHKVTCLDTDRNKIELLQKGKAPFYEEGLEGIIKDGLESGQLSFTRFFHDMFDASDIIFLCLGTPSSRGLPCSLKTINKVCAQLKVQPGADKLIVVKSTVPPGTNDEIVKSINECEANYYCASNPEFLREGQAVRDFLEPERIVLGVRDKHSLDLLLKVYAPIDADIFPMDTSSAELSKYACNAALAAKISFINEISNLCEVTGANILSVRDVMATDSRIGSSFYEQGPGYGGSCFPKDVKALVATADKLGENLPLIKGIVETNNAQPLRVIKKIEKNVPLDTNLTVAIWGAAFKDGTDDTRCSVVIPIIKKLLRSGVKIRVHDPKAIDNLKKELPPSNLISFYKTNPIEMTKKADVLIVATPWEEYSLLPVSSIGAYIVVDCRGSLDAEEVIDSGKIYETFGRIICE